PGWRAWLAATLGASLILALILNLAACMQLAQGAIVVPFAQDEALIHLELWGFASTMVLAVSGRVFPKFLLLQPTRDGLIRPALVLATAEMLGVATTLTELSAARHVLVQGFLLPLIVLMAARILPGYSGYMLHRSRLLAALVWSLLIGAALRGGAELVGGYSPGWSMLVALGGTLAVVAFIAFAVGLWRSTAPAPVAAPQGR